MRKLILISAFVLASVSVQAVEARELILAASDAPAAAAPAAPAAAPRRRCRNSRPGCRNGHASRPRGNG